MSIRAHHMIREPLINSSEGCVHLSKNSRCAAFYLIICCQRMTITSHKSSFWQKKEDTVTQQTCINLIIRLPGSIISALLWTVISTLCCFRFCSNEREWQDSVKEHFSTSNSIMRLVTCKRKYKVGYFNFSSVSHRHSAQYSVISFRVEIIFRLPKLKTISTWKWCL